MYEQIVSIVETTSAPDQSAKGAEKKNYTDSSLPPSLHAATYCERLVKRFMTRNPHYDSAQF